jgi:hypothetical protein
MSFVYPEVWTVNDVEILSKDKDFEDVQFFEPVSEDVLQALERIILSKNPDYSVRFYGFYRDECDLSLLKNIPSVRNLCINCMEEATNIDAIGELKHLVNLNIGVLNLKSLSFLESMPATLTSLSVEQSKTKKVDLSVLTKFKDLKELYLEGHSVNIENIVELSKLEKLTLRSVTLDSLQFLTQLKNLWAFDLKLGGTKDLSAIKDFACLKYLEIWQVRGLADLGFLSECVELQYLFLQSLKRVEALPTLKSLKKLRRVYLENMKGLADVAPIVMAPALEDFYFAAANNFQPEDFDCFKESRSLKKICVGFGSDKRNNALRDNFANTGIEVGPLGAFEFR